MQEWERMGSKLQTSLTSFSGNESAWSILHPPSPPELGKLLSDWLIARSIWPIRKQYCSSHFTTESEKTKTFRTTRFLRFMDYPDSFSEWGNIASLKKKKNFQRMFAKTFGFSDSGSPLLEVKLGMLFSFSFPWSLFIVPSPIPGELENFSPNGGLIKQTRKQYLFSLSGAIHILRVS